MLKGRPNIDRSYVTFLSCTDNDQDIACAMHLPAPTISPAGDVL